MTEQTPDTLALIDRRLDALQQQCQGHRQMIQRLETEYIAAQGAIATLAALREELEAVGETEER